MSLAMARLVATDGAGDRIGDGTGGVTVGSPPLVSVPGLSLGEAEAASEEGDGEPEAAVGLAGAMGVAVRWSDATADDAGVGAGVSDVATGAEVRSGRSTTRRRSPPDPSSAINTARPSFGEPMIVRGADSNATRCRCASSSAGQLDVPSAGQTSSTAALL